MSSQTHPENNPLHQYGQGSSDVQHSRDRALTEREFELLLEGARQLKGNRYYYDPDPELIMYVLGRLGLRRGELVHLQEDWIDWREQEIRIPAFEPCLKGEDGYRCGMCRDLAKQRVDHNDGLEFDQALDWMWAPKSEAGVRDVYFGHDVRAQMYLERYFEPDDVDEFVVSGASVSRRVKDSADLADELEPEDVHPHGLRSTAATHMAARPGTTIYSLLTYFGWKKLSTAEFYLARSSKATARQLDTGIPR